ncbi:hypothetical protein OPQ81_010773 [Rhizoctonia solani]|nr:hypothetical protein OPQ81_010773 [Rhizoctonia solani]
MLQAFRWPSAQFEQCELLSKLVVTNIPTGLLGGFGVCGRDYLKERLAAVIPEFNKFKLFLEPDWIANPARLQAEGRIASAILFTIMDHGKITTQKLNDHCIHIDGNVRA